jgi:hypothetical protein
MTCMPIDDVFRCVGVMQRGRVEILVNDHVQVWTVAVVTSTVRSLENTTCLCIKTRCSL